MKVQPPRSPARSPSSPSHDALRRITKSGGSAKSPLGPSPRSGHTSPAVMPKSPAPRWRGGPRLSQLRASQAGRALQELNVPNDTSTQFGPSLMATSSTAALLLPLSLSSCPRVTALFTDLERKGRDGQTCVATLAPGGVYWSESREEQFSYCLPVGKEVKRIRLAKIRSLQRDTDLDASLMLAIFQAISQNKAIPPIKVDERCRIDNGFHRFFASKLLGYTEIDVEVSSL